MTAPIIQFSHVTKGYGDHLVLDDLSLSIEQGEFVTVLGRSGCGKTTFLKLINALLLPDAGTICVDGKDVSKVDQIELRRSIGYVIQNVGLFPHMSVKQNIEYVPSLFRKKPKDAVPAEKLLEIVSLDHSYLNCYPSELSGGEKQRVGIARALATMPSIVLMDEPFGAVDEITRRQLQESISDIQKKLGITIIFITHSVAEALRLGTKVAIFGNRQLIQYDTPQNVVEHPVNAYVKELIGNTAYLEE